MYTVLLMISTVSIFITAEKNDENEFCLASDKNCGGKTMKFGKMLDKFILAILPSISLEDCVVECGRRPRCESMNYYKQFPVCELNHKTESRNRKLTDYKGALYTEKSHWQEGLLHRKCNPEKCNAKQACVKSGGTTECEISDCDTPPSARHAIPNTSQGISIYSKVTYSCKEGFELVGKSAIACQRDGEWSPIRFSCKKIKPFDCSEVRERGEEASGAYVIYPCGHAVKVYCKMDDGGVWTVLTARVDAHLNFNRSWDEYRDGFGLDNVSGSYWLGNKNIRALTRDRSVELKFEVRQRTSGSLHVYKYANFSISSNSTGYKMTFDKYPPEEERGNGTAYGSICPDQNHKFCHNKMKFSTYDKDNDKNQTANCAAKFGGGWWYNDCHGICLTGIYDVKPGYRWEKINGNKDYTGHLRSSYMMIRPNRG